MLTSKLEDVFYKKKYVEKKWNFSLNVVKKVWPQMKS